MEKPVETITEAASKGGIARAKSLSEEERSEAGRRAVEARWSKSLPKATHEGFIRMEGAEIPCAVLEDGRRLLTLGGFMKAIGRARQAKGRGYYKGDVNLPTFLTAQNLKPFIPKDLEVTSNGIEFLPLNGGRAYGYLAEFLPKVCWVFSDAKNAGALKANQVHIADRSLVLVRALTSTSLIALVDEATGYQYERPRRDLEEYLKKFLAEELTRWARTFPGDYFKHLCRLKGVELRADMRLPQYFGHLTNDIVYSRIAPGLLRALKDRKADRGKPSNKLHWWTSEDYGHPSLLLHLGMVVGLMKIHTNWEKFYEQLNTVAPVQPDVPGLFDDPADWDASAFTKRTRK